MAAAVFHGNACRLFSRPCLPDADIRCGGFRTAGRYHHGGRGERGDHVLASVSISACVLHCGGGACLPRRSRVDPIWAIVTAPRQPVGASRLELYQVACRTGRGGPVRDTGADQS